MDVESGLKLPTNTDTEVIMEDSYVLCGWLDELSIDEAEANICVDAKELFEGASGTRLNGQYTKAETNQSPGIIKRYFRRYVFIFVYISSRNCSRTFNVTNSFWCSKSG